MIRHSLCAAVALLVTAAPAMSATYDPLIGRTTPNGQLAEKLVHTWFIEAKPAEVFDNYVSKTEYLDHYGDHTTDWAQTRADEVKMTPPGGFNFQMKQLVAQGDLVFMHMRATRGANDPGNGDNMVIIFRFKDGKLVESWNIHTPIEQDPTLFFGDKRPAQTGYSCVKGTCSTTRPPPPAGTPGGAPNGPPAGGPPKQ